MHIGSFIILFAALVILDKSEDASNRSIAMWSGMIVLFLELVLVIARGYKARLEQELEELERHGH